MSQVLTRRVKGGSVPPTAGDSGTLEESRSLREDFVPPIGVDVKVRSEIFSMFPSLAATH